MIYIYISMVYRSHDPPSGHRTRCGCSTGRC